MTRPDSAREQLETLCKEQGLDRLLASREAGETISAPRLGTRGDVSAAATVAAPAEPRALAASKKAGVSLPELPAIGISLASTSTPGGAAEAGVDSSDLQAKGLLGEGGMGRVVLAHQRSLDRDVAVKLLPANAPGAWVEALLHEALVMGALEHPNIVPVHALGRDSVGKPLLVMK